MVCSRFDRCHRCLSSLSLSEHTDVKDNEKDMLQPAIEGTRQMLEACKKESSVKRVVVTSSFAAVLDMAKIPAIGTTYS
jgi:nucleoside-diphosphate-sugar epimerase